MKRERPARSRGQQALRTLPLCILAAALGGCVGYVKRSEVQEQRAPYEDAAAAFVQLQAGAGDFRRRKVEGGELWESKGGRRWCGVMPMLVIPIPLMLPLCSEHAEYRIESGRVVGHADHVMQDSGYICSPVNRLFNIGGDARWCRPK